MNNEQLQSLLTEAEHLNNTGNPHQAEILIASLLSDHELESNPHLFLHAMAVMIRSLLDQGRATDALPYAETSMDVASQNHARYWEAKAHTNLAMITEYTNPDDSVLPHYRDAENIFKELGAKKEQALVTGNIGNHYKNKSDYSKALEYYRTAIAIEKEIGNYEGIARHSMNIAVLYRNLGDLVSAIRYHQNVIEIAQHLQNNNLMLGHCYLNVGIIYSDLSNTDTAIYYYHEAMHLFEELGNKYLLSKCYGNLANLYRNAGEYSRAFELYHQAIAINKELEMPDSLSVNTGNLGLMYFAQHEYDKALDCLLQAYQFEGINGNRKNQAGWKANIASIYGTKSFHGYDLSKSKEYVLESITISEEVGAKSQLVELYKNLAEINEAQNDTQEAFANFKKYHYLDSQLHSDEAVKQSQQMEHYRKVQESEYEQEIKVARHQATQELLHNVLPPSIAHRMIEGEKLIAEKLPSVSVLFADIVNFTKLSQRITAEELVEGLDTIFSSFDILAEKHGLEKIKTIGDAYMVVSGAPEPRADHAEAMAEFALEMVQAMKEFTSKTTGEKIQLRIGIHSGEVVAGVIGKKKFAYDLWGDAVNTASRMESHGEAGKIHISDDFRIAVETCRGTSLHTIEFIERGEMEIKGKGMMKTYFLERA